MTRLSSRSGRSGFTLVELLLGVALSAIVLAAAAALAFAVSAAWHKSENVNEVVGHVRGGVLRLSDRIRGARAVGYTDAACMLIWRDDANDDEKISQSELTLFRREGGLLVEGQLLFPAGITQAERVANDAAVSASQFVTAAAVQQLAANKYYRSGTIADYVQDLSWVTDAPPPATALVQVRLLLSKDGLSQMLHSGMAVRAPGPVE